MTDPRERRLSLPTGLDYSVLEWGGEDPVLDHTVVLVHGFLDAAAGFEPMVAAGLAGRFHVVAPDLRGHGRSDRVGAGGYYHFFDYVADLHGVVRALGRRRVSLVGHSMGGSVCLYLAGATPERFTALALLEGVGPPEDATPLPERVRSWLDDWPAARARRPRGLATLEEVEERLRAADPLLDRAMARRLAPRLTELGSDGRYRFLHDPLHQTRGPTPYREDHARQFFEAVSCPVLLVDGTESSFAGMAETARRRAAWLRDARSVSLEGAGHMLQRHRPRELAALLGHFLEQAAGAAP